MTNVNRFAALVAGISLLICGILGHRYLGKDNRHSVLQKGYDREIARVRQDHADILALLDNRKTSEFKELAISPSYPYYIFADGKIIYWSTNYSVPSYATEVAAAQGETLLKKDGMCYVRVRTSITREGQTYDIVSTIDLLRDKNYTQNFKVPAFNSAIFFLKPDTISPSPFSGAMQVTSSEGRPVFYTDVTETLQYLSFRISPVSIVLIVLGVLLIWYTLYVQSIVLSLRHRYIWAGILMGVSFLVLRLLMRYFNIPWIFFTHKPIDIFYGNLFIDTLCVLIILTKVALAQYKALLYIHVEKLGSSLRAFLAILCILFMFVIVQVVWWLIDQAYQESLIEKYYSVSFYLSNVKDTMYVYLFILLGIFFLSVHSVTNLYRRLVPNKRKGLIYWVIGTVLGGILSWALHWELPVITGSFFFLAVYLMDLARYFYRLRSFTYLYYIIGALTYTLLLFHILFLKEGEQSLNEKYNFADTYLSGKDRRLERQFDLLSPLLDDTNVFHKLLLGEMSYEEVNDEFLEVFRENYLDHFLITFEMFDSTGNEIAPHRDHQLSVFTDEIGRESEPTEYSRLFLSRKPDVASHYTFIHEVRNADSSLLGTALFRLFPNRGSTLGPEAILQTKKVAYNPFSHNYSYAVYDSLGHLIHRYGKYNYRQVFDSTLANELHIFEREELYRGYSHIARVGDGNRFIVVSEKRDFYKDALANFSFLFFMSMVGMIGLLVFMGFFNDFRRYQMNLSGKIQFYLNGAFLMPLTIIMVIGSVVMNSIFSDIRDNSILTTSRSISEALNIYGQNYTSGEFTRRDLRRNLDNLARISSIDIDIYNMRGVLAYSSYIPYQSLEARLHVNPEAFSAIRDGREEVILLDDFQEKIKAKTAFVPVKSLEGNITSIAALNFIDAETAVQSWTRQVWQILLIVFFVIFFVLYIFSFISSRKLTQPLKLIAEKIKSVSFHEKNKEIVWEAKDEIGLLTGEYNRMLKKLDESKQALSINEKRSAWRDMAKQLAHEIRNPLTPMMLSVQQLQRLVLSDHPDVKKRILQVLGSISDQIENIIGISLSFSKFAEMPLPTHEEFDLVAIAKDIPKVFHRDPEIHFESEAEELWVRGDSKIIKKTLMYLIKNGIDSVPAHQQPVVRVSVTRTDSGALLEVSDNGASLSEESREKVFRPVFSEKNDEVGFGLSLSKISIEHFGGNIWFESEEGKGKAFFIELQITEPDEDDLHEDI